MIQVVYDKIVNFCGVTKIPCVIVGSKCDLSISYVSFSFLKHTQKGVFVFFLSILYLLCGVCVFFFKLSYLSRQVDSTDGEKLAKVNDCAWIETSAKNGTNISMFIPFFFLSFWVTTFPTKKNWGWS